MLTQLKFKEHTKGVLKRRKFNGQKKTENRRETIADKTLHKNRGFS